MKHDEHLDPAAEAPEPRADGDTHDTPEAARAHEQTAPEADVQLTAYALGELGTDERAAVEARLAEDAAARAHVDELRAFGARLARELAAGGATSPAPLTPAQRAAIAAAAGGEPPRGRLLSSPWSRGVATLAATVLGVAGVGFFLQWGAVLGPDSMEVASRTEASRSATSAADAQRREALNALSGLGYGGSKPSSEAPEAALEAPEEELLAEREEQPALQRDHRYLVEEQDLGLTRRDAGDDAQVDAVGQADSGRAWEPRNASDVGESERTGKPAEGAPLSGGSYRGPGDSAPSRSGGPGAPGGAPASEPESGPASGSAAPPGSRRGQPSSTSAAGKADADGEDGSFLGRGEGASGRDDAADSTRRQLEDLGYVNRPRARSEASPDDLTTRDDLRRARRARPGGEDYALPPENPFVQVASDARSTFSIDVDTASYANVRRFLRQGQLPPPEAVRIEELVNAFAYDYPAPEGDHPFAVHVELVQAPWASEHKLLRVGLQGRLPSEEEPVGRNLVFLVDVSGSMSAADKLPLVQRSLELLVDALRPEDSIGIVTYAGQSGIALQPTPLSEREVVLAAIQGLRAGGSTNGAAGIVDAYRLAQEHFIEGGVNRVVLATDGDFNVGVSDRDGLERLITQKRASSVFLSVLGFGQGNLQDAKMETLANKGNGNYSYIDSVREARKVLVRNLDGTLETIAKDVKLQLEFNPLRVQAFRLIGYENRMLEHRDFTDPTKDAGEIGAGHSVTALYELVPVGAELAGTPPLRYQQPGVPTEPTAAAHSDEALFVALRYKHPDGNDEIELSVPVADADTPFAEAGQETRFAAAVASFGMLLRESPHAGSASLEAVREWAAGAVGADPEGDRNEFLILVDWAIDATR